MTFSIASILPRERMNPIQLELDDARRDLDFARQTMNHATSDYVEVAVHLYNAALAKYEMLLARAKKAGC